jgi:hypothetical protein
VPYDGVHDQATTSTTIAVALEIGGGYRSIADLWGPWMRLVDELLEDEQLLDTVYERQGARYPQSRTRGRMQTPAEVVLPLLLLKHMVGASPCMPVGIYSTAKESDIWLSLRCWRAI